MHWTALYWRNFFFCHNLKQKRYSFLREKKSYERIFTESWKELGTRTASAESDEYQGGTWWTLFTSYASSSRNTMHSPFIHGKMRIRCTRSRRERTRARKWVVPPRGRIRGNCYPNTMEGTTNAKPTTGKEPRLSLACCTTWTSARNNTNHYTVTAARRSRARSVIWSSGAAVWAASPPLTTHFASRTNEFLSPLSVCRVVDGGRLASVLRYSWVGGSCSNIPHHRLWEPRPTYPSRPIADQPYFRSCVVRPIWW